MSHAQDYARFFTGVVEDVNDPEMLGRVRVRIHGVHTHIRAKADILGIGTEELLWAYVMQPVTSAAISGIGTSPTGMVEGTHVFGIHMDKYYQNNIVIGTTAGQYEELPNFAFGFSDPNKKYPSKPGSDVNTLATGQGGGAVARKKESLESGFEQSESSWGEPEPVYGAKYPMNQVTETRSGHTFEVDDTPGSERLTKFHKSGTYEDMNPDGSKVTKVVGSNYEIVCGDDYIAVKGNVNIFVGSNADIKVGGNATVNVTGDMSASVKGNRTDTITGAYTVNVDGAYTVNAKGGKTDNITGTWSRKTSGEVTDTAGSTFSVDGSRINLG